MDIRTAFPSKYLKAADLGQLPNRSCRLVIAHVDMEELDGKSGEKETKPVVYFKGAKKGLVLNKTNGNRIAGSYGWDTDQWLGHPVDLYVAEVDAFGDTVEAIRVKVPLSNNAPVTTAAPAAHVQPPEIPPFAEDDVPPPTDEAAPF